MARQRETAMLCYHRQFNHQVEGPITSARATLSNTGGSTTLMMSRTRTGLMSKSRGVSQPSDGDELASSNHT